jgi:hypothetical protein
MSDKLPLLRVSMKGGAVDELVVGPCAGRAFVSIVAIVVLGALILLGAARLQDLEQMMRAFVKF